MYQLRITILLAPKNNFEDTTMEILGRPWACFTFDFGKGIKDGLLNFEEWNILIFYHFPAWLLWLECTCRKKDPIMNLDF